VRLKPAIVLDSRSVSLQRGPGIHDHGGVEIHIGDDALEELTAERDESLLD
jgi:hypothetical protein